jgi:hypothetical protein
MDSKKPNENRVTPEEAKDYRWAFFITLGILVMIGVFLVIFYVLHSGGMFG